MKFEFQEQACGSCVVTACVNAVQFLAGRVVADVTTVPALRQFLAGYGVYKSAGEGIDGNKMQDFCKRFIEAMMKNTLDSNGVLLSEKYVVVNAPVYDINQDHKPLSDNKKNWGEFEADPIEYAIHALRWETHQEREIAKILDDPKTDFVWRDNTLQIGKPYEIPPEYKVAIIDAEYKFDLDDLDGDFDLDDLDGDGDGDLDGDGVGHVVVALRITQEEMEMIEMVEMIENGTGDGVPLDPGWFLLDSNAPDRLMSLDYVDISEPCNYLPDVPLKFLNSNTNKNDAVSYLLKPPFAFIKAKPNISHGGRAGGASGGAGPGAGTGSGGASIAALLAGLAVTAVSSMVGASSVAP